MNKTTLEYMQNLHSLFEKAFIDVYQETPPKKKRNALPYLQAMYRRWYYSTIVEETPMSPANILESICRYYDHSPDTFPIAHLRKKTKLIGIDMKLLEYSLSNHPIVADLNILIDYYTPHIDLDDDGLLDDYGIQDLTPMLSLNDPHYAVYLMELALEMQLVTKAPSVGINRYKPNIKTVSKLQTATSLETFREIVDAAIILAAKNLSQLIPDENLFTISYIRAILTNPIETDELFDEIYALLGYDLEDLIEIMSSSPEEESEDHNLDLLMSTFTMGIFLDKYFYTPFGHFMKLIRPMYVLPFDLSRELKDFLTVCHDSKEGIMAFYAPCSSYTLTDMGLELLNIQKSDENYIDVTKVIPFGSIKDSILSAPDTLSLFVAVAHLMAPLRREYQVMTDIFTFRVRLANDTASWIHLQIQANATLHDMYEEIAESLDLKGNGDYSFFHDKTENRFAMYSSPKRKRGGKIATETTLESLDWEHQKHMLMVAYNQSIPFGQDDPITHITLEMMHKKPAESGHEYPRVSRYSKKLQDMIFGSEE